MAAATAAQTGVSTPNKRRPSRPGRTSTASSNATVIPVPPPKATKTLRGMCGAIRGAVASADSVPLRSTQVSTDDYQGRARLQHGKTSVRMPPAEADALVPASARLPRVSVMRKELEDSFAEIDRLDAVLSTREAHAAQRQRVGAAALRSARQASQEKVARAEQDKAMLVQQLRDRGVLRPGSSSELARPSTQGGCSAMSSRALTTRASTAPSSSHSSRWFKREPKGFSVSAVDWDPRSTVDWWCEASTWAEGSTWWGWAFQPGVEAELAFRPLDSALIWAAETGSLATCQILVSQKADVNATYRGNITSLMLAAANGHTDVVKLLVESSADANFADARRKMAVHRAVYAGHSQAMAYLLQHAAINSETRSHLLHSARLYGHVDCIAELTEMCAEVRLLLPLVPVRSGDKAPEFDAFVENIIIDALVQAHVQLGIRPSHIRLSQAPPSPATASFDDSAQAVTTVECAVAFPEMSPTAVLFALQASLAQGGPELPLGTRFRIAAQSAHGSICWPRTAICTQARELLRCAIVDRLDDLLKVVEESAASYCPQFAQALTEDDGMRRLQKLDSRASYGPHTSIAMSAAHKQRLAKNPITQERGIRLARLYQQAVEAQSAVKRSIAPDSPWAECEMNSIGKYPLDHPMRVLRDASLTGPGGYCFDPGIMSLRAMKERAAALQELESKQRTVVDTTLVKSRPPYDRIVDASEIRLVCPSATALLEAIHGLRHRMTVVSVDNRFRYLPGLGYGDVRLGVRIGLDNGDYHLARVVLSLSNMDASVAAECSQRIRDILRGCGVPRALLADGQHLILDIMDTTDGHRRQREVERLHRKDHQENMSRQNSSSSSIGQITKARHPLLEGSLRENATQWPEVIILLAFVTFGRAAALHEVVASGLKSNATDQREVVPHPEEELQKGQISSHGDATGGETDPVPSGGQDHGFGELAVEREVVEGSDDQTDKRELEEQSSHRVADDAAEEENDKHEETARSEEAEKPGGDCDEDGRRTTTKSMQSPAATLTEESPRVEAEEDGCQDQQVSGRSAKRAQRVRFEISQPDGCTPEPQSQTLGDDTSPPRKQPLGDARQSDSAASVMPSDSGTVQPTPVMSEPVRKRRLGPELWQILRSRLPVQQAVASSLVHYDVQPHHVRVQDHGASDENKSLYFVSCSVCPRDASALAVKWSLDDALIDPTSPLRCNSAFHIDVDHSCVEIAWPVAYTEGVVKELFMRGIGLDALWKLVRAFESAATANRDIFQEIVESEVHAVAELSRYPSLALYNGVHLMPAWEARHLGMLYEPMQQSEKSIDQLRIDAVVAHRLLKEFVAPQTEWATTDMNDLSVLPENDPKRIIEDTGVVLGGFATDIGVKSRHEIEGQGPGTVLEEQMKDRMQHKLKSLVRRTKPAYHRIVDMCRLRLSYHTAAALLDGFECVLRDLDYCYIKNHFRDVRCTGFCDIVVGVRLQVRENVTHVGELNLSVVEMYNAQAEVKVIDDFHKVLREKGLLQWQLEPVARLIFDKLDPPVRGPIASDARHDDEFEKESDYRNFDASEMQSRVRRKERIGTAGGNKDLMVMRQISSLRGSSSKTRKAGTLPIGRESGRKLQYLHQQQNVNGDVSLSIGSSSAGFDSDADGTSSATTAGYSPKQKPRESRNVGNILKTKGNRTTISGLEITADAGAAVSLGVTPSPRSAAGGPIVMARSASPQQHSLPGHQVESGEHGAEQEDDTSSDAASDKEQVELTVPRSSIGLGAAMSHFGSARRSSSASAARASVRSSRSSFGSARGSGMFRIKHE